MFDTLIKYPMDRNEFHKVLVGEVALDQIMMYHLLGAGLSRLNLDHIQFWFDL